MNKGVEILLRRIESHPEEFNTFSARGVTNSSKWLRFAKVLLDPDRSAFVTDAQRAHFKKEFERIQGDAFTSEVVAVLLEDQPDQVG
jgi:16S rRNA G527 N7-methylase RsmG